MILVPRRLHRLRAQRTHKVRRTTSGEQHRRRCLSRRLRRSSHRESTHRIRPGWHSRRRCSRRLRGGRLNSSRRQHPPSPPLLDLRVKRRALIFVLRPVASRCRAQLRFRRVPRRRVEDRGSQRRRSHRPDFARVRLHRQTQERNVRRCRRVPRRSERQSTRSSPTTRMRKLDAWRERSFRIW